MKKRGCIISGVTLGFLCSETTLKAAAAGTAPWQTYLDKAPIQAEQFAADPLGTLLRLFAAEPVQLLREVLHQYAGVLQFLSLAAGLAFLLQDTADKALLELAPVAAAFYCGRNWTSLPPHYAPGWPGGKAICWAFCRYTAVY